MCIRYVRYPCFLCPEPRLMILFAVSEFAIAAFVSEVPVSKHTLCG